MCSRNVSDLSPFELMLIFNYCQHYLKAILVGWSDISVRDEINGKSQVKSLKCQNKSFDPVLETQGITSFWARTSKIKLFYPCGRQVPKKWERGIWSNQSTFSSQRRGLTKVIWVILNFDCKRSEGKKKKGISTQ